jgi:predicted TIM-barrel fold metal-dependent hydrolase
MARKKKKASKNSPETSVADAPASDGARIVRAVAIALAILAVAAGIYYFTTKHDQAPPSNAEALREEPAPPALDAPSDAPLKPFHVVNAHEHLFSRKYLDKYLAACQRTGIVKTLFVASSEYTLKGKGSDARTGNDENSEELLAAAREHPDAIIPFCTIHPGDPQKLDKLKGFVAQGAKGLKLYTGHGNFYERPLDAEEMMPVYAYCAETGLPICWHVNFGKYKAEFERVLERFPRMRVIVPHFGVTFFQPGSQNWNEFEALFDKYPNLYTDTSFGTREILVSGLEAVSSHPEPFKAFIRKHPDRVLWGTDMVITGNKEKSEEWIAAINTACRNALEKDVYAFPMGAKGGKYAAPTSTNEKGLFRGLALEDDTLRKIYETNIQRLWGNAE